MNKPDELCQWCGKHEKLPPHPCIFKLEVHGDIKTLCTCCDECKLECFIDVYDDDDEIYREKK